MILWMIYSKELEPIFSKIRSVEREPVFSIILEALGGDCSSNDRERLIREHFASDMAERLIAAEESGYIENLIYEFEDGDEPMPVSPGFVVLSSDIDWDNGVVNVNLDKEQIKDISLFYEGEDIVAGEFSEPTYEVSLAGFCFLRQQIEMMQPHIELAKQSFSKSAVTARTGRPRIWDWEGATTYLLSIAQTPDGLPTGPGAQAQIERFIADWFVSVSGNTPSSSQLRQHAAKIMRALKAPESP